MRIDAYTHFIPEKYFNKIVESGHEQPARRQRKVPPSQMMKEPGGASRKDQPTALLISFTRSVFSQEKPPSLSGARPKWP